MSELADSIYSINAAWKQQNNQDETRVSMNWSIGKLAEVIAQNRTLQTDKTLLIRLQSAFAEFKSLRLPEESELIDKEATVALYREALQEVTQNYVSKDLMDLRFLEQKLRKMSSRQIFVFDKYKELRDGEPKVDGDTLEKLWEVCMIIGKSYADLSNAVMGQMVYNTHFTQEYIRQQIEVNGQANSLFDDMIKDL